jgi:diacylglycerol kinase family enzyme
MGKKKVLGGVYRYEENAFFSIDGERYPAQRLQGRVLKGALPIFY